MKISVRAKAIEPSLSRKLFNMAKNYNDVIDLTLGDPDIPPAQIIKNAACESIQKDKIRYSANAGLISLRKSIADNFNNEYGIATDKDKNIVITVGGMEALFLSLACMIDEGDEVIIIAPYYVNYKQMVSMCSGVPVIVNTQEENNFIPREDQILSALSDKTVAIIVNSPSNPTGVVFDKDTLDMIANVAKANDLAVISDEVYRTLVFDGESHRSIASIEGMKDRTVVIDSSSKRFAMTGYRVGFAVGPEEIIANMVRMQENVAACAPVSSQYATIAAFEHCVSDTNIREEFEARRNYIYESINSINGLSAMKPQATFYLFVNVEKTNLDGLTFAYKLLEQEQVAVVPGITYGEAYKNYIRIAFTVKIDVLKIAVERITHFINNLMK